MKQTMVAAIFLSIIFCFGLDAHTPKNALGAVAVSPDGKTIAAGGDNRVLYLIDPLSLKVQKRIWLKTNIYEMTFNNDGSILVVEDTSENLQLLNTRSWQVVHKVAKAGKFSAAPAVDLMAGLASGYRKSTVKLISMTNASQKGKIEFAGKVEAVGIDANGKRLVVLAQGPKDAEQKKKKPKELRGLEADKFKQRNDGKVSILAEYDVASGKKLKEKTIFYTAGSSTQILVTRTNTYILSYSNINANIKGDTISLFKSKSSYNYGIGISPDRKAFLVGGLRSGTLVKAANLEMIKFNIDTLPGWPEYYKGFAFGPDGTAYAGTTAYRLVRISKDGKSIQTVPVF